MFFSNKFLLSSKLITLSLAMVSPQNIWASDSGFDSYSKDTELIIGAGFMYRSSIYVEAKDEVSFYPSIDAYWGPVFFSDYKVGSYFAGNNNWALSLSYGLDNQEDLERESSALLKDMPTLKNVFVASIKGEIHHDLGDFTTTFSIDTSNEHQGKIIELGYSYPWISNKHSFSLEFNASWISKEVSQYYYGVQLDSSVVNRPYYQPSNALNLSYGVNYDYALSANQFLFASVYLNQLSDEIKNSPIVEKAESHALLVGFIYKF
jgi:outer membrane protein